MMTSDLLGWVRHHDIVVLEGCDGTGKTTLATELAAHHGHVVVHAPRSPDGTDLVAKYRAILAAPGPLVLDRSYISELVYGPLDHCGSRLSRADAEQLTGLVSARGGILVHLTGRPEILADRLAARDGLAVARSRLRAITAAYHDVFTALAAHATAITIDTTVATP